MADRFWVLGTGTWDNADPSHWSAVSGGAGGASVPTLADNAIFDANSGAPGAYTVTAGGATPLACRDLNFSAAPSGGGTVTWAGNQTTNVYGSLTLLAGMVRTFTASISMQPNATLNKAITSNGVALASAIAFFGGAGNSWMLADALNTNQAITFSNNAVFDSNNKNIAGLAVSMNQPGAVVTLGTSTVTLAAFWSCSQGTLNALLSTILVGANSNFTGGGRAYGTVVVQAGTATQTFQGANSFVNLTLSGGITRQAGWNLNANQTVTGVLKYRGDSAANRLMIQSDILGTPRTITAAAIDPASDFVDFQDIAAAGAAAPFNVGASIGDALGNSGITFTPSVTQTATGTGSIVWGTHGWTTRVPLPQDDVIIPNAFIAGRIISIDMPRIGRNVTFTCTGAPNLSFGGTACAMFGNLVMAGNVVPSGSFALTFAGRGVHSILSAGCPMPSLTVGAFGGTYSLADALNCSALTLNNGTFNDVGFPVAATQFVSNGAAARTLNRSGTWSLRAVGTVWAVAATLTLNDTGTTKFIPGNSGPMTFAGAGLAYRNLWHAADATKPLIVTGSNTFAQFKVDAGLTVQVTAGTTQTAADWQIGDGCTINSVTAAAHTLAKSGVGAVHVNGATITNSTASPAATFFAHGSVDGGGNTNWTFPPARFWVGGTGNWSDAANHWAATSGGAPGAGNLPTSLTDAIFNAASNATGYTVTLDTPVKNCLDLILGAPATGVFTIAGTSNVNVFGNFVVAAANVTPSAAATLLFSATAGVKTITTNDVPVQFGFNFAGVGGTTQLAGDLYGNGNTFQVAGGTFDPNGKTVTLLTQQGAIAMAGNIPFYNLNLTNRAQKPDVITLAGNLTVANVFKYRGNSAINRLLIQSNLPGAPRTITAAVVDAASDFVDFMDIAGAGVAAPFAVGSSLGNCLGNSGITFTPSATQTGTGTASLTWTTHAWAGAPGRIPLPQDDVVIPNAFIAGRIITMDMPRAGRNVTFTCTGNPTISAASVGPVTFYGSIEFAAGMTVAFIGGGGFQISARSPITLRTNGVTIASTNIYIVAPGATITLGDAFTCNSIFSNAAVAAGLSPTFDTAGFPFTCGGFQHRGNVLLRGSTVTLTGTFGWTSVSGTVFGGTSTIKLTDASATVKPFNGNGNTFYNLWLAGVGTGAYTFTGNNTFNQFRTDNFKTVQFTAGSTTTANDWLWGTDNTIGSITAASHTIVKTGTGIEYVVRATISRSNALPVGLWHAVYSTDGGNNTGWSFAVAAVLYSWPMMYVGNAGAPAGWVNTDAGNATGTIPGLIGAPAWSDNPALCLRDFLIHRAGLTVDENYAASAATWCDQLITGAAGTEKRCTMTLALTEKRPVRDWIETLRAYVPAWVVDAGGAWRIVADMPRAVDHFFGAGSIDSQPPPQITRTGTRDTPNAVDVSYTDTTKEPWQTYPATAELATAIDVRRSNVSLPGIRRFSQAKRFAIERLNHYTLEDTVGRMSIFDYGLRVLPGDVAQVSEAAFGWAGRPVRILAVDDRGNGRWDVEFREYDPAAYSTEVQATPTIPETALSSPLTVLAPTTVNAVEVLTAESNLPSVGIGTGIIFQSRVRLTFVESLDPYLSHYDVLIYNNPLNPIVARVERGVERWLSPAVQQLTTYTVEIRALNTLGIASPTVSQTLFIDGKQFPPGDVPAITQAFEVGGEVLLTWEPAADFDTLRYEWRVDLGNTGKAWDAMLLVDSVDGLRARFRGMPEGAHRFCVRALDSVGNYSVNSRCALITVTSDASAFMQDVVFSAPTLTNMVMLLTPFSMDETPSLRPRWATSAAATSWDASLPSPVDAGVLAVRAYGAGGAASSWRGEVQDVGTSVAGDFAITARVTSYVGAVRSFIEHSIDNIAWGTEEVTGGLSWRGEARFLRVLFQSNAAGDSFLIEGEPRISVSAAEGKESGGPVMSSATLPTRINLVARYGKATIINVTPLGSAPRTYTVDAVTVGAGVPNHFDVYLFNAAGAQIADNFMWNYSGV